MSGQTEDRGLDYWIQAFCLPGSGDRLQAAFWSPAVKDRDKKAADIVLKCIRGRIELRGLAAPAKVEHSGEVSTEYRIVGFDPEELV